MDDIYAYFHWRGDLLFSEAPFNEVDSLILTLISYVDFDGIIHDKKISLKTAADLYWGNQESDKKNKEFLFLKKVPYLLKAASGTRRFSNLSIGSYVNLIDYDSQKQFSAITFYDKTFAYVAYRGTDATVIGWKEDFNMSFLAQIPAQSEAVRYLNHMDDGQIAAIRVGGHSKGGNLAIYASMKCQSQTRDKILSVHNFDGPGFSSEIIHSVDYHEIMPRITEYIPRASIIGLLFEHAAERKIIKSNATGGFLQHDSFSWEVAPTEFAVVAELDKSSLVLDNILKEWISKLDTEKRECFVDALYDILNHIGIVRVGDFIQFSNRRMITFLRCIHNMPLQSKSIIYKSISRFIIESANVLKKEVIHSIDDRTTIKKPHFLSKSTDESLEF